MEPLLGTRCCGFGRAPAQACGHTTTIQAHCLQEMLILIGVFAPEAPTDARYAERCRPVPRWSLVADLCGSCWIGFPGEAPSPAMPAISFTKIVKYPHIRVRTVLAPAARRQTNLALAAATGRFRRGTHCPPATRGLLPRKAEGVAASP